MARRRSEPKLWNPPVLSRTQPIQLSWGKKQQDGHLIFIKSECGRYIISKEKAGERYEYKAYFNHPDGCYWIYWGAIVEAAKRMCQEFEDSGKEKPSLGIIYEQ